MKTMLKKLPVAAWLFVASLLVFLFAPLVRFAYDAATMPPAEILTIDSFAVDGFVLQNDTTLVSVSDDPQLIYTAPEGTTVRTVHYMLESGGKGAVCAYYAKTPETPFSERKRLWPAYGTVQDAFYTLPLGTRVVRLDITSASGDVVRLNRIVLNERPAFLSYWVYTPMQLALFVVLPLLLAAGYTYLRNLFRHYSKKEIED